MKRFSAIHTSNEPAPKVQLIGACGGLKAIEERTVVRDRLAYVAKSALTNPSSVKSNNNGTTTLTTSKNTKT